MCRSLAGKWNPKASGSAGGGCVLASGFQLEFTLLPTACWMGLYSTVAPKSVGWLQPPGQVAFLVRVRIHAGCGGAEHSLCAFSKSFKAKTRPRSFAFLPQQSLSTAAQFPAVSTPDSHPKRSAFLSQNHIASLPCSNGRAFGRRWHLRSSHPNEILPAPCRPLNFSVLPPPSPLPPSSSSPTTTSGTPPHPSPKSVHSLSKSPCQPSQSKHIDTPSSPERQRRLGQPCRSAPGQPLRRSSHRRNSNSTNTSTMPPILTKKTIRGTRCTRPAASVQISCHFSSRMLSTPLPHATRHLQARACLDVWH